MPPPEVKVLVSGSPSPTSGKSATTHDGNQYPSQDGSDSPDPPLGSPISPTSFFQISHDGNQYPSQDRSDSPDPPLGSAISPTSFSQITDDESDPATTDVMVSKQPRMFFDIISLQKKTLAQFHPTKFIGNRNRKYPHYSVTATLQSGKVVWKEFNCPRGHGEDSTLSEATKFANSYKYAIWLLCEHFYEENCAYIQSVSAIKFIHRKIWAGPTLILSFQYVSKSITKSFTYTDTPCGHAELFLKIQNCFTTLTPSFLESKHKWVWKGSVQAGKEAAAFVENLPFDVNQHRIHDPSVVVHRRTRTLAVSIA